MATSKTYTIPADGSKFEIQNQLQEGYIYDITVKDEAQVVDVELKDKGHNDVVMGEVTAIGENTITVNGKTLNTADSKTYEITSKAGGSSGQGCYGCRGRHRQGHGQWRSGRDRLQSLCR